MSKQSRPSRTPLLLFQRFECQEHQPAMQMNISRSIKHLGDSFLDRDALLQPHAPPSAIKKSCFGPLFKPRKLKNIGQAPAYITCCVLVIGRQISSSRLRVRHRACVLHCCHNKRVVSSRLPLSGVQKCSQSLRLGC